MKWKKFKNRKNNCFYQRNEASKIKRNDWWRFSESQLAKFEKGETEITVGKLFTVLENSNVYLDEFQNLYNEYEQSYEYNYRHELAVAYAQKISK